MLTRWHLTSCLFGMEDVQGADARAGLGARIIYAWGQPELKITKRDEYCVEIDGARTLESFDATTASNRVAGK